MIKVEFSNSSLTLKMSEVCNEFISETYPDGGVTMDELRVPSRKTNYVDTRHALWFILRKNGFTTVDIAEFFNLRSHASIILYACSHVQDLLDIKDKAMLKLLTPFVGKYLKGIQGEGE